MAAGRRGALAGGKTLRGMQLRGEAARRGMGKTRELGIAREGGRRSLTIEEI